jgi:cyclophilin family peptidyl-prolyl cis-trans isomerase
MMMKIRLKLLISILFMSCGLCFRAPCDEIPFQSPPKSEILKIRSAVIKTNKGSLYFELFPEVAPLHVTNFKYLADKGFFTGATFKDFEYILQAKPTQRLNYSLPPEFSKRPHTRGALGMARWEDEVNPERRSSATQFHILKHDGRHMDTRYSIFGTLVKGWKVLDNLRSEDSVTEVIVYIRKK